jgi:diguanylate cyclase (GGDEF)-like protein/PAS domain S-box-containing protein
MLSVLCNHYDAECTMLGYRSNDGVVTICQNNAAKSIEITAVNKPAEDLLGFSAQELVGKNLFEILPPRIGEMLKEYVEFDMDANDVGQVLSKVQSFSTMSREGKETGFRLKVVRTESTGNTIFFELVLQDKTGLRKNEALRKAIQDNFKGHEVLDKTTGLPDRYSLGKDIELMGYYSNKGDVRSCFAVLQLDHYDELMSQYGRPACDEIVHHLAHVSRQSLRPDDIVGSVNYKRIGVLLIDTTIESARMAVNRLRWQIAANPFILHDKTSLGLSVSISFSRIGGRVSDKSVLDNCENAIEILGAAAINVLTEVEDHDRRGE